MFAFDQAPFEQRLAETIGWCAPRARAEDPKSCLRSEELRPRFLERDRASTVQSVAAYRGSYASGPYRSSYSAMTRPESLRGGRLLVYFPDADLADGAAQVESGGFFDVHNVPPWDTWIALADDRPTMIDRDHQQYLLVWVPPPLIACAQAGIDVNPEQCIAWLEDTEVDARRELQRLLRPSAEGT